MNDVIILSLFKLPTNSFLLRTVSLAAERPGAAGEKLVFVLITCDAFSLPVGGE